MKNKLLTLLVALIVTFSLSYVVMAKTQDADKSTKNEVVSQEVAVLAADDSDLSLDKDSLTLEPGETATITGTLDDEDLDIEEVEVVIGGDDVVDVDIDKDNNQFTAKIKVDNNADDNDECTLEFTVTDDQDNTYKAECDISIEEENGLELSKTSLTLEPGNEKTITGTLDDEDLDISKVQVVISGDQVVEVGDIERNNNKFEATIKVDEDADDGDECTITFKVTDDEDNVYEEDLDVAITSDEDDNDDEDIDDDDDDATVDKNEKTNCPAAPAIANKILKENGIKNKNKETGVNYISQIAKQKGKGASFNGVNKKDKQDYEDAVRDYLEDECDLDLDD